MATEKELLCTGWCREATSTPVVPEIIVAIDQYLFLDVLQDAWDDHMHLHNEHIACSLLKIVDKYTLRSLDYTHNYIKYAIGQRIINIDPNAKMLRQIQWNLRVTSRHRRVHVCCGIGIAQRKHLKQLNESKSTIFSSNYSHVLNAKRTAFKSLIGVQCGTFNQEEEYETHRSLGVHDTRSRWRQYGHVCSMHQHCNGTSAAKQRVVANLDDLSTSQCCFMDGDALRLALDLRGLNLRVFVNGALTPKYTTNIQHIEAGEYSLCVWLLYNKQNITILP